MSLCGTEYSVRTTSAFDGPVSHQPGNSADTGLVSFCLLLTLFTSSRLRPLLVLQPWGATEITAELLVSRSQVDLPSGLWLRGVRVFTGSGRSFLAQCSAAGLVHGDYGSKLAFTAEKQQNLKLIILPSCHPGHSSWGLGPLS